MATIPPERWLPIRGWERYEVSDLGRVRSLRHKWGPRLVPLVLKPKFAARDGYPRVTLYCGSPRTPVTRLVHHLVLQAFAGPCPDGMEARHGPGGRQDARLVNLCWGTHSDNVGADRVRDGTINRGERHPLAQLTAADVAAIRSRPGEPRRALAAEFGTSPGNIGHILRGESWSYPVSE
jgi:NUMOD4 motif/HNH endonuclease